MLDGVGIGREPMAEFAKIEGHAGRHQVSAFGGRNGWPQAGGQAEFAIGVAQAAPGIDGARYGDGVRRIVWDGREAELGHPLQRGCGRGAPGAVEGNRRLALGGIKRKAVAADAGHMRIDDALQGDGGDGRIDGIATGAQHIECRQRGLWMGGRDHGISGHGDRFSGAREITRAEGVADQDGLRK